MLVNKKDHLEYPSGYRLSSRGSPAVEVGLYLTQHTQNKYVTK
jgi:hypothetical protein